MPSLFNNLKVEEKLTDAERAALQKLKDKLVEHVQPIVEQYGAAFVKSSSRSPKDAVFSNPKVRKDATRRGDDSINPCWL